MHCGHPRTPEGCARNRGKSRQCRRILKPVQLQETPESLAGCAAVPELVYDLRLADSCSDGFYEDVAQFADQLLAEIEGRAGDLLEGYTRYVQEFLREAGRSRGEYAIELLTLGVSLRQYGGAAESTPGWVVVLARELYWLRRRSAIMKPPADLLRAAITRFSLVPRIGRKTTARWNALDGLPRLIEWLQAAGEFEQEAVRLKQLAEFSVYAAASGGGALHRDRRGALRLVPARSGESAGRLHARCFGFSGRGIRAARLPRGSDFLRQRAG